MLTHQSPVLCSVGGERVHLRWRSSSFGTQTPVTTLCGRLVKRDVRGKGAKVTCFACEKKARERRASSTPARPEGMQPWDAPASEPIVVYARGGLHLTRQVAGVEWVQRRTLCGATVEALVASVAGKVCARCTRLSKRTA